MSSSEDIIMDSLHEWKQRLTPLKVDIVGDFAGKELFAIHGESLVTHCVATANVDYLGLAAPPDAPKRLAYKYLLTRAVAIENLRCPELHPETNPDDRSIRSPMSFVLPSITSPEFLEYTNHHRLHFVMMSQSRALDIDAIEAGEFLKIMYLFGLRGYSLAFIDGIEFRSSKAYTLIATPPTLVTLLPVTEPTPLPNLDSGCRPIVDRLQTMPKSGDWRVLRHDGEVDAQEEVAIIACAAFLLNKTSDLHSHRLVATFLSHIALLKHATLPQRAMEAPPELKNHSGNEEFLATFAEVAIHLIKQWPSLEEGNRLSWRRMNAPSPKPFKNSLTGTESALETSRLKEEKTQARTSVIIKNWEEKCRDFDKDTHVCHGYLRVKRHLPSLSPEDNSAIGGEVMLYMCNILGLQLIRRPSKNAFSDSESSILAMIWAQIKEMMSLPLAVEVIRQAQYLMKALKFPQGELHRRPAVSVSHRLPFTSTYEVSTEHLQVQTTGLEFQLAHCGPYLERSFDSAPDPRVSFSPDAWQRDVLDAIDEDKSLFVVTPTSAGKTFISFYAMKKVLQNNDDYVLVYVAPTKALVNQIAAEVQARFSKSYRHEGRSVWAIHTRDYRVNNPTGCQVLVTVPQILQIMLLASTNAQNERSWAPRVKRIIFDEVHCIGHAEDGIIWQQLLLLAPCPIIAISATVGNPLEFKEWLAGTQKAKGFDLEMIVHLARYSDLRKFLYQPPSELEFEGLEPVEHLPIPGLDAEAGETSQFTFVHPVGSIINKNRETLDDASLEPRDCLRLWLSMREFETESYRISSSLKPEIALPELVKKSDIIKREAALKAQLWQWQQDPNSPLPEVYQRLKTKDPSSATDFGHPELVADIYGDSSYSLLVDLHSRGALPAIHFNYDRLGCEKIILKPLQVLEDAEQKYHGTNASRDISPWEGFDPKAPLPQYNFADTAKLTVRELEARIRSLDDLGIKPRLIDALRRGLGVHHAGMNRQYRQGGNVVRKGYLTVVIATGTLALGLNMPCKTVVFTGDSVFLTALSYRQASGRAGRRGFDPLGNIVFHGIPHHRAMEIIPSRLPDLRGQFPISVTLVLRLFTLLHSTNNSQYAIDAVESLLTQTRLFLGGPSSQMTVKHHLRFSIEYLRRQQLLSRIGAPLNFSGLVGHLYFTENAVFALHSLLKEGYLHKLCEDVGNPSKRGEVILTLVTVLCHLFCRIPCSKYKNREWLENVVHRSPSTVLLPRIPIEAEAVLRGHNEETLRIFKTYVHTFIEQNLQDSPDDHLPFTKRRVGAAGDASADISMAHLPMLPYSTLRSPFSALSGFTDDFATIHELCDTFRASVFLDESAIPYVPIYPEETDNVPWNAYIYDFFKHGDLNTLVRDNGIKGGDVWFRLKDFSLILATIVTSLENILDRVDADDADMIDIQDVGDALKEGRYIEGSDAQSPEKHAASTTTVNAKAKSHSSKSKETVAESWEDLSDSSSDDTDHASGSSSKAGQTTESEGTSFRSGQEKGGGEGLMKVLTTFKILQQVFEDKFRKVWA
ncbi:DEAD/DEAH box helicase [Colletotrichum salicis]|uniref:DEAD/DEAH box helicase n=1 Tax=Colletotrichum salicis TaxID=1209931 RepID=A0A135U9A6_9PEZI|nr:DEAD/DEAH box helicase [Colletotrichum salicis]